MKNSMVGKLAGVLVASGLNVGCAMGKEIHEFAPVELNYVVLADDTNVTAQPVLTKSLDVVVADEVSDAVYVDLDGVIQSRLAGMGGAFNEIGGEAYSTLSEAKQKELVHALFNAETGSGFSFCRTAVGASDFGLSEYSYSEVADDYEMEHFSIERDIPTVIAFIKAAQAESSEFSLFASPWSPPAWMKVSGSMDGGDANPKDNILKDDPKIFEAYALYFQKYLEGYAEQGVMIDRLIIQNEPDMNPKYPGCDMPPEQMADLTFNYIKPTFDEAGIKTELWAGSFRAMRQDAETFVAINGVEQIDGIGLQYCRPNTFKTLHERAPSMPLMHTEGACENGQNTMRQARKRFGEVAFWLNSGCENYCYWNMVLNEKGASAWGWKQNSLITVDRDAGTITYNSDYAPISLFSRYIRPGDQSLKVVTSEDVKAIAVKNADRLVVFLQNNKDEVATQDVELSTGAKYVVELPANALCAVVLK